MRYSRLIFGSALSLFALPVLAAEPGTYRPGTPYYSTQATSADICERQCSGDAQCKGWNFIAVNPNAANGVCEFNSTDAAPVPSDISISGSNGVTSYSRRVARGGTSTVRVGSPVTAPTRRTAPAKPANVIAARTQPFSKPPAQNVATVRPGARALRPGPQSVPTRRVIRKPVPQRIQPGLTAYRSQSRTRPAPAMPHTQQRPRFRHNLDPGVPQGFTPRRPARAPAAQPPQGFQGGDPRLQNMVRRKSAQPAQQSKQVPAPAARPTPQAQARPAPQAPARPQRPLSLSEAEQSLFGSLHDDVKMPKAMTAAEQSNPDEPIATVTSVPVKKVTAESLMDLAGGPNP